MAHINEKIDFTVTAYIVYQDKVLLRHHEKYSMWLGPGGHIELDEGPEEAVVREAKEETGLDIEIISEPQKKFDDSSYDIAMPMVINRHFTDQTHEHIDFMYAARTDSDSVSPAEGEEANPESFRWFSQDELENFDQVSERVKYHALKAIQLSKV